MLSLLLPSSRDFVPFNDPDDDALESSFVS